MDSPVRQASCCRRRIADGGRRPLAMRRGIGAQMLAARRRTGMTQREVAGRMGTKYSSVSRAESGRTRVSIDFLERFARALGQPITITFGSATTPPTQERRARAACLFTPLFERNGYLYPTEARYCGLDSPDGFDATARYAFALRLIAHADEARWRERSTSDLRWPGALATIWYDKIDWTHIRDVIADDRKAWRADIRVRRQARRIVAARGP